MIAVISDIHANLAAFEVVLNDIAGRGIDEIWCLGDLVGYGPDPKECVDLVAKNTTVCVMGNHDWALLNSPVGFNSVAAGMIYKTKEWMKPQTNMAVEDSQRWEYIERLPRTCVQGDFMLVHGSPRHKLTEYVLPSDASYYREKLSEIFSMIDRYCLVGHSHLPCVIWEDCEVTVPDSNGFEVALDERKAMINVGSVGQPRDGDNRACFLTLDGDLVRYHRLPYPIEKTIQKMDKLGDKFQVLPYRLGIGR